MNHRRTKRKKTKPARKTFARRAVQKNKKKDQRLSQIRNLEKGTPILVPDEFVPAADESFTPSRGLTEALLQQAREAVSKLRAVVKERFESSAEETDRLQTWLKSAQAKEFVRHSPELKEVFSGAGTVAKTLAKEQAEALSAEESALGKIKSQLAAFRVK